MRTHLPGWAAAAAITLSSTHPLLTPAATAAEGDVAPTVVAPAEGTRVPYGFTGPVRIDYTAATPGTWRVQVACATNELTYDWQTTTEHDGTTTVVDYTLPDPITGDDGSTCAASVVDATPDESGPAVQDSNVFTVGLPPVQLTSAGQHPGVFYPHVVDGRRDVTRTGYALSHAADVVVRVRNDVGARVRVDQLGEQPAGDHEWTWDGRVDNGSRAPKGGYTVEVVATDADGHRDSATTDVRVATKLVTRTDSIAVSGASGVRKAKRGCTATRYDGVMTLDCWGGRYAQATYGFRIPKSAYKITWRAAGRAPSLDICCDGRITKTGERTKARSFVVRVRVTGWRAYEVRRVSVDYRYKERI
jgi:hypothetical protein